MINWKTTLSGIILLLAGAIAVSPDSALTWLGDYKETAKSAAGFIAILAGAGGLAVAKDNNVTHAAPRATEEPRNLPLPLMVALLLPACLVMSGCTGALPSPGGDPPASVGLSDADVKAIRDATRSAATLAIRYGVDASEKVEIAQKIHDVSVIIEGLIPATGLLPSAVLDARMKAALPAAPWADSLRGAVVAVYRTWGKYGTRVVSALAGGLADATENLTP